jgi:drug/metabolite transporter (DMT)-like permease
MPWTAITAAVMVSVLLGADQVTRKIALEQMSPLVVGALSNTVGSVALLAYSFKRTTKWYPQSRAIWRMHAISAGLMVAVTLIALVGVHLTTAGRAAIFNSVHPLFIVLLASRIGSKPEVITPMQVTGMIVSFFGVVIVFSNRLAGAPSTMWQGDLMILASAFVLSLLLIHVRRVTQFVDPLQAITWQVVLSVPGFWAAALFFNNPIILHADTKTWLAILYQGLLIAGFTFVLRAELIRKFGAGRISAFFFITPIVGVVLGAATFGDDLGLRTVIGCLVVLLGVTAVQNAGRIQMGWKRFFQELKQPIHKKIDE